MKQTNVVHRDNCSDKSQPCPSALIWDILISFRKGRFIALPCKIRRHTRIILSHLLLDINIPPLTPKGHCYRKPIYLSEQLLSYAYFMSLVIMMNNKQHNTQHLHYTICSTLLQNILSYMFIWNPVQWSGY